MLSCKYDGDVGERSMNTARYPLRLESGRCTLLVSAVRRKLNRTIYMFRLCTRFRHSCFSHSNCSSLLKHAPLSARVPPRARNPFPLTPGSSPIRLFHHSQIAYNGAKPPSSSNSPSSQDSPKKPSALRENIYTIPNLLTVSRIIACPVLGLAIVNDNFYAATGLLVYAGLTDLVRFALRCFLMRAARSM